jgi:hypothetical protein
MTYVLRSVLVNDCKIAKYLAVRSMFTIVFPAEMSKQDAASATKIR